MSTVAAIHGADTRDAYRRLVIRATTLTMVAITTITVANATTRRPLAKQLTSARTVVLPSVGDASHWQRTPCNNRTTATWWHAHQHKRGYPIDIKTNI